MLYKEKDASNAKFVRRQAALDLLVEMIRAMVALDSARDKELYLPVTTVSYLLIAGDCLGETMHNDFAG